MANVLYTAEGILRVNKRLNTECGPNVRNVNRNFDKLWWRNVYLIGTMNNLNQNLDSQ